MKSFFILTLLVILTACGSGQENTAPEETEERTIETQEEIASNDSEEFQWLYNELNGKSFRFSSGVGAWRTSISLVEDGKFSGVYSDANGPEVIASEFTGHFDIQKEVDEFTYLLELNNLQITSDTGKEEVDGDMTITYVDEPHGFQSGSRRFELYLPLKPKDQVSDEYLSWVYGQANNEYDFLNSFGLYNANHQFGMEELLDD